MFWDVDAVTRRPAGCVCGDDDMVRLAPDMAARLISYACGRVFNRIEAVLGGSDSAAGLIARTIRDDDARAPKLFM